jgi:hypothetical protein
MLTAYHTVFVEGVIRAFIGCLMVLILVPRLLVPRFFPGESWRNRIGSALLVSAFLVGLVHLLVFAHLNDSLSFSVVLGSIIVARLWHSGFSVSDRHMKNHIASILRFLDSSSFRSVGVFVRTRITAVADRRTSMQYLYALLLMVVLAITGFVRVLPAWNHAAPFSIEYYETLQKVKQLQINQMYTEGYRVPLGLPIAAQVLTLFSQVNSALLLHFLGALSSVFLAASICYVVYRSTFSIEGGIVGAAIFGLFSALLPLDLRHQIEADSLVLAMAFALPALSFFIEFCAQPGYRSLLVALAGLLVAATVNLFVGCFALVAMVLILVVSLIFVVRLPWLRGVKLLATVLVTVSLGVGCVAFFRMGLRDEGLKNALQILLYDKHLNRYFSLYAALAPVFVLACYCCFGMLAFFSLFRYKNKAVPLHLFSWGFIGGGVLALVPFSYNEILSYIQYSQAAFLLSNVLAINAGIVVSIVAVGGAFVLDKFRSRAWISSSWKLVIATTALGVCGYFSMPKEVTMEFTAEPDGFATSLYIIEQKFMPYQWTVVSHRGTALSGLNQGRFLDYEYFIEKYDPLTYAHGTKQAVPTPLLFFFVERAHQKTEITTELSTTDRNAEQKIKDWLQVYDQKNHNLRLFYSDDKVLVYELEDRSLNVLRG